MKKRVFLIIAGLMVVGTLLTIYFLPRFLIQAATEKPDDVGEFVTAPVNQPDFIQRVEQAIDTPKNQSPRSPIVANSLKQSVDHRAERRPEHTQRIEQPLATEPELPEPIQVQTSATPQQPHSNSASERAVLPSSAPEHASQATPEVPASTANQRPGSFELQVGENDIAGMIYNGMHANIAPQYKQALQGVSVQLRNGRAKVTVKLLPKHLPDQYLDSLPGVTRESPPLYLGGEVVLQFKHNTIQPKIYNVSLGNLRIPIPAIESMIKGQIQSQVQQITRLQSGQQAQLDSVTIQGGLLTVNGHVK